MSTIVSKIGYIILVFFVAAIGAFVFLYYIIVNVLHLSGDEAENEDDDE